MTPVSRYSGVVAVAAVAATLGLQACPSRARLDAADRSGLDRDYQGRSFFLKQSLFFGRFYDDASRRLVDARAFGELRHMTAPDGEIIVPPPPLGIIPAGTRVQVERIELPNSATIFKRPLFTPRYNVWIVLKVARYQGDVELFHPEPHVWVLPPAIRDHDSVRASLAALLSEQDLEPWLAQRSDDARLAIAEKRAQPGLSFEELLAALGHPDSVERRFADEHKIELARYGDSEIELVDDVVRDVRARESASTQESAETSQAVP